MPPDLSLSYTGMRCPQPRPTHELFLLAEFHSLLHLGAFCQGSEVSRGVSKAGGDFTVWFPWVSLWWSGRVSLKCPYVLQRRAEEMTNDMLREPRQFSQPISVFKLPKGLLI